MSFLPPVVLEIRAQAAQFFAETAKVAEATKAMATKTAASTEMMSDKVGADAAEMGKKVVASTEAMSVKSVSRAEAMARSIVLAAEQMDKGMSVNAESMSTKVVASVEAMAVKTTAAIEKSSRNNTAMMQMSTAKIIASQDALAIKIAEVTALIEASQAKQSASGVRTAESTAASGLSMQRTFVRTAEHASASMGVVSAAFASAAATQATAAAKMNASFMGIANGITKVAAVTGIALAAIGTHLAAEFEKQTMLLVTAGGESKARLGQVREGILSIAKDTGTSTEQLAEGMYVMEKAGYRGAEGLAALRASAEGAKAENVGLAVMTDAVTTTLLDYHMNMSNATEANKSAVKITNQMIAASGAAKTTMNDYVASMAAVVPIASSVGISFAEVGGSIATMTQHGQTAQQSSQNLANLIQALIKPNNLASSAMQQMGIDTVDLAQKLGDVGLSGTLRRVQKAVMDNMGPSGLVVMDTMKKSASATATLKAEMATMPPELAKLSQGLLDGTTSQLQYQKASKGLGGEAGAVSAQFLSLYKSSQGVNDAMKNGQPAMMTYQAAMTKVLGNVTAARAATMLLMNDQEDLNRSIQLVADAADQAGTHVHSWADTQSLLSTQLDMAKQRVNVLAIEIGTKLIPVANGALKGFSDLWDGFEKGDPILMGIAGVLGGVVTLSVVNFTIKMVQAGIAAVTNMVSMGAASIVMGQNFIAGFLSAEAAASSFTGKMGAAGGLVRANLLPALGGIAAIAAVAAGTLALVGANSEQVTPSIEDMTGAMADLALKSGDVSKAKVDLVFARWGTVLGKPISEVKSLDEAIGKVTNRDFSASVNAWADQYIQPMVAGFGILKGSAGQMDDRFKMVGDSLAKMVEGGQTDTAAKGFNKLAEAFIKNGSSAEAALDKMPAYKKSLEDIAASSGVTLSSQELLELAMGKVPDSMKSMVDATETYTDAGGNTRKLNEDVAKSLDDMGISIDGQITNLGKLYDAMVATGLANLSARDSEFHFGKAVEDAGKKADELRTKLEGNLSSALDETGKDFSRTTEAGQAAEEAFSSVARAGLNTAGIMSKDVTKSQEDVQRSLGGTYTSMVETAKKFGLGAQEAENLTRKVLGIPDGVTIDSWMNDSAKRMANDTKKAIDDIPPKKESHVWLITHDIVQKSIEEKNIDEAFLRGKAKGGLAGMYTGGPVPGLAGGGSPWEVFQGIVPGKSPSNPNLDNVLAKVNGKPLGLRSGEFVMNEPQTKSNMPWLKAMNAGLNMNDLFQDNTPSLEYASSNSLRERQAAAAAQNTTNNDNKRIITNNVSINSTADAKSLAGEFSRLTANLS